MKMSPAAGNKRRVKFKESQTMKPRLQWQHEQTEVSNKIRDDDGNAARSRDRMRQFGGFTAALRQTVSAENFPNHWRQEQTQHEGNRS